MKRITLLAAALVMMVCAAIAAGEGEMLRLSSLPWAEESAPDKAPAGSVLLTLGGEKLPYDASSNTYLIARSAYAEGFDGGIAVHAQEGYVYRVAYSEPEGGATVENPVQLRVVGEKEDALVAANICFTQLPVLRIDTTTRQLPGDEDTLGEMRIFCVSDGKLTAEKTPVEVNERGNTSRRFPKRSYRVKLTDDRGEKRNLSIAGLRSDDDWILNPMYTDTSKIREKLAYDLWMDFNSSGSRAASSRLEYVEVYFGEKYWGLYGIQERIDNKQVAGSKKADVLYKVTVNDRPTVEELLSWEDRIACRAFEAQYGEEYRGTTRQLFTPAASYMSMLGGGEAIDGCEVVLENAIDYGLFVMLTQAFDCHFKNQFLNCVYADGGYDMYKIPWDLNHTFGDVWRGDSVQTNYSGYVFGEPVYDGYFEALIDRADGGVIQAIQARWAALRGSVVTQEALMCRAQALYDGIYPALLRDSERWPQCGMGDGNAMNILDIQSYFEQAIPLIDGTIANLATQEETGE